MAEAFVCTPLGRRRQGHGSPRPHVVQRRRERHGQLQAALPRRHAAAAEKVETIATEIYGAAGIAVDARSATQFRTSGRGLRPPAGLHGQDPVLVLRPTRMRGAPTGHIVPVREVQLSAGAGFIVVITRRHHDHAGTAKAPSADSIRLDDDGQIEGLF